MFLVQRSDCEHTHSVTQVHCSLSEKGIRHFEFYVSPCTLQETWHSGSYKTPHA